MHPHPPSPPPRKLLKLKSPFLFIYYFIFGKSQIGWLLIRLHLFHIKITLKSRIFLVITVKGKQCWRQAVLKSGSVGLIVGGIVFYKHP